MTAEEAGRIVDELKRGRRFAARTQEQEWRLERSEDGRFRKWACERTPDGRQEDVTLLTEGEVIDMLVRWYRFDVIMAQLR